MATTDDGGTTRTGGGVLGFFEAGLATTFAVTLFLSASLLFAVQPMFAKMALPLLGGAPNVWNTAMVFFQATLLAGYVYAHLLSRLAPLRLQVVIHTALLIVGLLFLPIAVASGWVPTTDAPAFWLIGLFGVSLGVPFFAVSANAPLLQRWFSRTDHAQAGDPYFLYAASNCGSLLALAFYPILFEPGLGLREQSALWKTGYVLLIFAVCIAGIAAMRRNRAAAPAEEQTAGAIAAPAGRIVWKQRALWIALAFVPSSLMLGVTSHLSTNVAAAPFLWVVPLGLYLLTFIFAFMSRPPLGPRFVETLFVPLVLVAIINVMFEVFPFLFTLLAQLAAFFAVAQLCHNRLSASRPDPAGLTEFYLCISVGGVLGGSFNALAAPLLFDQIHEYPLMLVLSGLALAATWPSRREIVAGLAWGAGICAAVLGLFQLVSTHVADAQLLAALLVLALGAIAVVSQARRPWRFVAGLAGIALALAVGQRFVVQGHEITTLQDRSFFGVVRVAEWDGPDGRVRKFVHGNTVHNLQLAGAAAEREPLAYYAKEGPFGQAVARLRASRGRLSVGVIGLGAGALACHAMPGESWTYYEIDPLVADMATGASSFTYMSRCQPGATVRTGDARLLIASEPAAAFDLVVVDAFSSDSVPAHLITTEALALYREKLSPGGLVFFHTTNRVVDVTSVAVAVAEAGGLDARVMRYAPDADAPLAAYKFPTTGVLIGASADLDRVLGASDSWRAFRPHALISPWTDDFSNVASAIAAHLDGGGAFLAPAKLARRGD